MSKFNSLIKKIVTKIPYSVALMLHNIQEDNILKKKIFLSTDKFYKLIDTFKNVDSIEKVVKNPSKKKIAITFDDGFDDVWNIAYPYCKQKNVPFTVFVTVEFLDKPGYLSTNQLIQLSKDPLITIGAHCYHHQPLSKLDYEKQLYELTESKSQLENIISKKVEYMAYPYGQNNKFTQKILRKNKNLYKACFIVGRDYINLLTKINKYKIPRMDMDDVCYGEKMKILTRSFV